MGYAGNVRSRARRRAARRCAVLHADAPASVRELLHSVEDDGEGDGEHAETFPETPDIFEPDLDFELGVEPDLTPPPRQPSQLARALAVAVGVEEACGANDNGDDPFVAPAAEQSEAPRAAAAPDEDPPFDAPDANDEIFQPPSLRARRWSDPDDVLELHTPAPPCFPHEPTDTRPPLRPAPAINIHVSWDRASGAALAEQLAANPLLARADVSDARGGIGGALANLAKVNAPDVLILETTLKADPLLEAVDALQTSLDPCTRVLIVGEVNDVTLLRELARRGITHYFLAGSDTTNIVRAICELHADADKSRVIAVVGSRGGAGASTIAHNFAWSLAEHHDASTTLIELDIAFGATAFSFDQQPTHSLADGVRDHEVIDEAFVERVGMMQTDRLRLIAAPALLGEALTLERATVGALIRNARRLSKIVVLDVPHHWDACIKDILERANDVLIVATPDLASLRNTKSLLEALKTLRPKGHEPTIILSMVGASKTTEISEKDFADAIDTHPVATFAFDPALFAGAVLKRQMLGEAAAQSPAARQIDDLAGLISGRLRVKRRKNARAAQADLRRIDATRRAQPATSEPRCEAPSASEQDTVSAIAEAIVAPDEASHAPTPQSTLRRSRPHPITHNKPRPKQRPGQPGTLRLAFALMALVAASMWYVEKRTDIDFLGYAIGASR